jgi:hypothetical protein
MLCSAHCFVFVRVRGQLGRHKYRLEINIRSVIKQTLSKLLYSILLPRTEAKLAETGDGFQILYSTLSTI